MVIEKISETSYMGMFKVVPAEGSAFFIRKEYLQSVDFDSIVPGAEFLEANESEILDAGLTCVVELKAVDYLARAEQSHFGLKRKLIEKKYDVNYIEPALCFLESKNYLSDERFARAWLNGRRINHYEGRTKLLSELLARGISREISLQAVNNFFDEFDEFEIACKAYKKYIKQGKSNEKLKAAMINAGFSYSLLRRVEEDCDAEDGAVEDGAETNI